MGKIEEWFKTLKQSTDPRIRRRRLKTLAEAISHARIAAACRELPQLWRPGCPVVLGIVADSESIYVIEAALDEIFKTGPLDKTGKTAMLAIPGPATPQTRAASESMLYECKYECNRVVVVTDDEDTFNDRFRLAADGIVHLSTASISQTKGVFKQIMGIPLTDDQASYISACPPDALDTAFRKGRPVSAAITALKRHLEGEDNAQGKDDGPSIDDLPGFGEAADWGRELAVDLADWKAGEISWSDVDRGILLSGPPGTGKTTFAGALARTCGAHLVAESIVRWQANGHLGDMLKAMRHAFDEAKKHAPCILFIDDD